MYIKIKCDHNHPQNHSAPLSSDSKDALSEQDRRLQLIRKLKLKLDEYFLHVSSSSEEKIDSDNNLLSFPEFSFTQCNDIWKSLQSLLSLFGEYLVESLLLFLLLFSRSYFILKIVIFLLLSSVFIFFTNFFICL
jgi:hypothetical protein